MVASLEWGGQRNGYISAELLTPIGGGYLLEAFAARQFAGARAELLREGIDPLDYISETYRDFAGQVYQKNYWTARGKPGNAATPGDSIHGWAKAIDFNEAGCPAAVYARIVAVMAKYGFIRDFLNLGETWHFSFREGQITTTAGSNTAAANSIPTATTVYEEEETMFVKSTGTEFGYIPSGWLFQMDGSGCWRALSVEESEAVDDAKYPIVKMLAKDIYNHTLKGGLREYSGDMHGADPGFQSGRLLFGYEPSGAIRAVGDITNPNFPRA
jgi:hypothetical protein